MTNISAMITPTSRPEKGEVLTEKDIFTVGSSTLIVGRGFPCVLSAIVSPICKNVKGFKKKLSGSRKLYSKVTTVSRVWHQIINAYT